MPEQQNFQRQVAFKVKISDILSGDLKRLNDINVVRINIIGTLVYKSEESNYASALVDDGSGRISLRTFDNKTVLSKVEVGDVVLVVGKIREFNNEKYVAPEIVKKLNSIEWLNVRKLELRDSSIDKKDKIKGVEGGLAEKIDSVDEVYLLVKKLDDGHGVSVEDIINNSSNKEAEKIVKRLLEKGDIFEVKPGILKVLE